MIINKKGRKTTIIAIIGILIGIAIFIFFFLGKIDRDDLTIAIAGLGTFIATIVGLISKDQDQTHTKN